MQTKILRALIYIPLAFISSGCALLLPAKKDLGTIFCSKSNNASKLYVFLPGIGDRASDFKKNGFFSLVEQIDNKADAIAVDAYFSYYRNRTIFPLLHNQVILPNREKYNEIILVGISMGGFGAQMYTHEFPGFVDQLVLLSPYMGNKEIINEISDKGGLCAWEAPEVLDVEDYHRKLWKHLKGYCTQNNNLPPVYLAFGNSDKFVKPNKMFASSLPSNSVSTADGGHDWKTWRTLFEIYMKSKED